MALNGNQMGDEIIAAIASAVSGGLTPNTSGHTDLWRTIGNAIVDHIKNNAVVIQGNDSGGDVEQNGTVT